LVREGRSRARARERRRAASVECVRSLHHARSPSGADDRGARRAALPRIARGTRDLTALTGAAAGYKFRAMKLSSVIRLVVTVAALTAALGAAQAPQPTPLPKGQMPDLGRPTKVGD